MSKILWGYWKGLFDRPTREAARRAKDFVSESYGYKHLESLCRAEEKNRWVFAVFYHTPARPAPYILVSVDKGTGAVTKLKDDEAPRYSLRGRK